MSEHRNSLARDCNQSSARVPDAPCLASSFRTSLRRRVSPLEPSDLRQGSFDAFGPIGQRPSRLPRLHRIRDRWLLLSPDAGCWLGRTVLVAYGDVSRSLRPPFGLTRGWSSLHSRRLRTPRPCGLARDGLTHKRKSLTHRVPAVEASVGQSGEKGAKGLANQCRLWQFRACVSFDAFSSRSIRAMPSASCSTQTGPDSPSQFQGPWSLPLQRPFSFAPHTTDRIRRNSTKSPNTPVLGNGSRPNAEKNHFVTSQTRDECVIGMATLHPALEETPGFIGFLRCSPFR